ncbi:hypothetical protein BDD12DRAFT_861871 [Trichophaea hybrida]|nr:hypothetical protein BDD12DRAFT_861871 [Trichophaea hybrida]
MLQLLLRIFLSWTLWVIKFAFIALFMETRKAVAVCVVFYCGRHYRHFSHRDLDYMQGRSPAVDPPDRRGRHVCPSRPFDFPFLPSQLIVTQGRNLRKRHPHRLDFSFK